VNADIDREAVLLEARKAADIAYSIAEVLADDAGARVVAARRPEIATERGSL